MNSKKRLRALLLLPGLFSLGGCKSSYIHCAKAVSPQEDFAEKGQGNEHADDQKADPAQSETREIRKPTEKVTALRDYVLVEATGRISLLQLKDPWSICTVSHLRSSKDKSPGETPVSSAELQRIRRTGYVVRPEAPPKKPQDPLKPGLYAFDDLLNPVFQVAATGSPGTLETGSAGGLQESHSSRSLEFNLFGGTGRSVATPGTGCSPVEVHFPAIPDIKIDPIKIDPITIDPITIQPLPAMNDLFLAAAERLAQRPIDSIPVKVDGQVGVQGGVDVSGGVGVNGRVDGGVAVDGAVRLDGALDGRLQVDSVGDGRVEPGLQVDILARVAEEKISQPGKALELVSLEGRFGSRDCITGLELEFQGDFGQLSAVRLDAIECGESQPDAGAMISTGPYPNPPGDRRIHLRKIDSNRLEAPLGNPRGKDEGVRCYVLSGIEKLVMVRSVQREKKVVRTDKGGEWKDGKREDWTTEFDPTSEELAAEVRDTKQDKGNRLSEVTTTSTWMSEGEHSSFHKPLWQWIRIAKVCGEAPPSQPSTGS